MAAEVTPSRFLRDILSIMACLLSLALRGRMIRGGPRSLGDRLPRPVPSQKTIFTRSDPPAVAYVYAPNRKAEQPIAHLAGFKGVLQVDGYAGYRALAEQGDVQLAFCWTHVRRRFYELAIAGPAPIASEALERIAALYAIEKEIRGRSAQERRAVRQDRTQPLLADLEAWLRQRLALISQKIKLAEAIRYTQSHWVGLTRFVDDGRIEMDTNIVERSIRPITLNRKNALFAGSDGGGENWAILASLIETCKLSRVDSQAYLADALTKIVNGHLNSQIDDLLPWTLATHDAPLSKVA
jgi:transposase